jgi:hypothetical protein
MALSVFWDNSNIWLVGRNVCRQREPGDEGGFRIHFSNMLDFVLNGRDLDYAFVGGSVPPQSDPLWTRFEYLGVVVDKQWGGEGSGGEIAVDEMIQLAMANRVLDEQPATMVLLTGDGSGYSDGNECAELPANEEIAFRMGRVGPSVEPSKPIDRETWMTGAS